ncbi:hypothetical protein [Ferruginibacter profundus]
MLTEKEMDEIAEKYIADMFEGTSKEVILLHEFTLKKNYGNIYVYNNKKYIETKDYRYALAGNAPFLVQNETGKIIEFGTAHSKDYYIQEYEADRWYPIRKS